MRVFFLSLLALVAAAIPARAEISITPLRQVLTADTPSATYRISNPSRRIVEGRVSWADLAPTESGYRPASAEERDAWSAAPLLAVKPAQFRLEPGAAAIITVSLRDPAGVPIGERRSHLVIETRAARTPLRKAGGGLELDIGLGVSTPVIVRGGPGAATARIGATRLVRDADGMLVLETEIEATGVFSAYGTITAKVGGPAPFERAARNVAAFPGAPARTVSLALGVERLAPGKLDISFDGDGEYEGARFAARRFTIAPPP